MYSKKEEARDAIGAAVVLLAILIYVALMINHQSTW